MVVYSQIIQSNTCVSYELAESDAHAESPTQIKSPWGGGSIFSVGEGINCPTLYSLSEYGHCVVVRR